MCNPHLLDSQCYARKHENSLKFYYANNFIFDFAYKYHLVLLMFSEKFGKIAHFKMALIQNCNFLAPLGKMAILERF